MPTIIRKSHPTLMETRREVHHALTWYVRASVWSPPTDIYETDDHFVVRVEIAGVMEDDLEVAVENNILLISGRRPDKNERRAYHQMEIRFGKFDLAVEIPVPVELEGATAEYKSGLLVIQLPKKQPNPNKVD
jgi:HSP20 family protein